MKYTIILLIAIFSIYSCSKSRFLDKKPSSNIVIPHTLTDIENMLDNTNVINMSPALATLSADEYFYANLDEYNAAISQTEKNSYTWQKDIYGGETQIADWNTPYNSILYANVALQAIDGLSESDKYSSIGQRLTGEAYFTRAYSLYSLAQIFCPTYDNSTAAKDLGLPLKLSPNIDDIKQRSNNQQTYDQILDDLKRSIPLLPTKPDPVNRNRPSKSAAYLLVSRISLNMRDYNTANTFADSVLAIQNDLTDFNTLDTTSMSPFLKTNNEIILYARQVYNYAESCIGYCSQAKIDTTLLQLYDINDLRLPIFYSRQQTDQGDYYFIKSGYAESGCYPFMGLAIDEAYLIKAECLCRANKIPDALNWLNKLLRTRFATNTFQDYTISNQSKLLSTILTERRKELVWRGIRWADIKRLNKEGANITLTRTLNGKTYTLPPNDLRYTMPIPDDEINLSHIAQNNR